MAMADVRRTNGRRMGLAAAGALAFVAVYVITAKLSNEFAEIAGISPWWLPSGTRSFTVRFLRNGGASGPASQEILRAPNEHRHRR
jgi:hypothetical protein